MVPSLQDVCFYVIASHITSFSAAHLAPIPSHIRLRLLPYAPAIHLWRLDRSPAFCRGVAVEKEWKRRIATHITAWKAPKGLEFISEREEVTFRESYLRYILRLLLTSTGEELMQKPSPFHVRVGIIGHKRYAKAASAVRDAYEHNLKFFFHLHSAIQQPLSDRVDHQQLISKYTYINFLFYGVHIDAARGRLRNFETYMCDPQRKYFLPHHYAADIQPSSVPCFQISQNESCLWFQKMVTLLKETSGWMPEKLDIVAPSHEFLEAASSESVSEFMSSVEEINVEFFNDVGFIEVSDALIKLFKTINFSPASICIKTRYEYQVTWLLPRLAAVCDRLSPCDKELFPHLTDQQDPNGVSNLRNITITTHSDGSQMSSSDWGVIMFQDKLESITLRACIPTNFPFLLSHLLATRPSLRLIDLTGCWNDYNSLQLVVSTFLFAFTDHPQSLIIKELPPRTGLKILEGQGSDTKIELPAKVSGPCRSGEHKTLCLPFISSGPCSLAWLLSLPELSLKTLDLIVREENYVSHLNEIYDILKLLQFPFKCTVFVCCKSHFPCPVMLSKLEVISQLRMCPLVKDVRFIIESHI